MSLVVKISIGLEAYETCGIVEVKFFTNQRVLDVICVDYDSQFQSGLLYVRDTALQEPILDPEKGDVRWNGYEQSVWLVRQKSHEGMELPSTAGAYLGKFPDPRVGRWLVFARVADRLPALPRAQPLDRQGSQSTSVQEDLGAEKSPASSKEHNDSVWPTDVR